MIGKLLGAATVGGTMAGVGVMHRFLVAAAQAMILVIISALMLCASLFSIFFIAYFCMLQFGVAPHIAGIVLGIAILLVTAALVAFTLSQIRQLRTFHYRHFQAGERYMYDLRTIAAAFIDGFLNKD